MVISWPSNCSQEHNLINCIFVVHASYRGLFLSVLLLTFNSEATALIEVLLFISITAEAKLSSDL
ncbi:hypothetical protein E2562_036044 [Oryza meyeriana var. granulata]|uniref:Uncharacterized protein n=1 Tax=Oryza meyeriana var. granulata TaxID=110450 RepID=A0A6G1DAJ2_9ORYZ|nr:hypothetical protein E2562_036044 [Oryza meyeriana var. granulata]